MAGGKPGVMPWCREGWPSPGRRNSTVTAPGTRAAPTRARSHPPPDSSTTPPSQSPAIHEQPHRALCDTWQWITAVWAPRGCVVASRTLTVGVAGQPHGGAPRPGEPGVRGQVRSGVCRPAPRARQGRASRHHQVGVQTVGGTAGGMNPGKIRQLLALSGHGGGKREKERKALSARGHWGSTGGRGQLVKQAWSQMWLVVATDGDPVAL